MRRFWKARSDDKSIFTSFRKRPETIEIKEPELKKRSNNFSFADYINVLLVF
jgi:hypothetical protein